ncbi:MAG: hypothetical protein OSB36_06360 [Longimicrobiales bacterium]|nr:hypothetical protein [Longimicrobiales bacterium]
MAELLSDLIDGFPALYHTGVLSGDVGHDNLTDFAPGPTAGYPTASAFCH